ncbi:MAG: hypothetical protein ACFFFG_12310 [Candidatus Thorarchaeota archaeon]
MTFSLRTSLLKAQNRTEGLFITLISFGLALITMVIILFLFSLANIRYNISEIINNAFIGIIIDESGAINFASIFDAFRWSLPLVLTGLSVAIAFRAGEFNIGGQGQMIVGGAWSGIWAAALVPNIEFLKFLDTPILIIPSTLLVGIIAGAIWGGIPGLLKAYTGAHEVITTILMNYVAFEFIWFLIGSDTAPFVDRTVGGDAYGQTGPISHSAIIFPIDSSINTFLSWTILFVILTVIAMFFVLWRTNLGFKIRAVGFSSTAALAAGIDSKKLTFIAMAIAGGLAGLAGAIGVIGIPPYRYVFRSEGTAGFDGIAVSLIGQNNPFPIVLAAIFFGFLTQGKINLDIKTDMPSELIDSLLAVVILFVAAPVIASAIYKRIAKVYEVRKVRDIFRRENIEKLSADAIKYTTDLIQRYWLLVVFGILLLTIYLFRIDIGAVLSLSIVLGQFMVGLMPMTALFVLLMPITYLGRKVLNSREKLRSGQPQRRLIFIVGIILALFELSTIIIFAFALATGVSADIIDFHFDVLRTLVSTLTFKNMLRLGFPIMFAAMAATFNERSGVINIGLEGIMLFSAWGGAFFTFASGGDPYAGIFGGILFGTILGLVHAIFTISFKAEQIVTGVAINLFALGITDLLTFVIWNQRGGSPTLPKFPNFLLSDIPILGDFLGSLQLQNFYGVILVGDLDLLRLIPDPLAIINNQSVFLLTGLLLIPVCHFLLFHTTFGLRLRVIGEEPQSAATAGIPVRKYQYIAVIFSAFLVSIGGIFLPIGDQSYFSSNMSGGKGFIGLAAMIFGKWTVIGSVLSSLFFGYFFSLAVPIKLLVPTVPQDFFDVLPFIIAIFTLAGAIGLARPPKSIGKPYDPQE